MSLLNAADALYLGAAEVDAVRLGSEPVWGGEPALYSVVNSYTLAGNDAGFSLAVMGGIPEGAQAGDTLVVCWVVQGSSSTNPPTYTPNTPADWVGVQKSEGASGQRGMIAIYVHADYDPANPPDLGFTQTFADFQGKMVTFAVLRSAQPLVFDGLLHVNDANQQATVTSTIPTAPEGATPGAPAFLMWCGARVSAGAVPTLTPPDKFTWLGGSTLGGFNRELHVWIAPWEEGLTPITAAWASNWTSAMQGRPFGLAVLKPVE